MHDPAPDFRALHKKGNPFILCNAWDIGSARVLAAKGAQALATSSAAHAFTLGRPDGGISRDEALAHAQAIVAATPLPVSGDFENGFGDTPEICAETVRLAAEAGLAGISIEDTMLPGSGAYAFDLAVERIKAAVAAARILPRDFVLVARADGMLRGSYNLNEAIRRLQAFEAAGADCLYASAPPDLDGLARICGAVTAPVNVLVAGTMANHSRADFARIGVARISLGSSLARITHRVLIDAAEEMLTSGSFAGLQHSVSGRVVDKLLS
ncbi:isocitrate lyase/phosphoenolpyruvate mutase family protein [Pseudooceanicola sp.]|uniref:isocitrate lyase/PEP mutase family protein n=1 Tax=Pseudooceanicola sp. TaxID=1914328 RepID=UPI00261266A0|nr:isocitrate lyase/phosphoenolpyruvate mutase family protein [Pseudooceanicola sp.]MDF1854339.1 isocitrate lyase/phosphoenolpyruvate mutase family protein [Pseudooceanicola sp.]